MSDTLLTIDIGNTTTHIGGFDGERIAFAFRLASTHTRTTDEAALLLRQILRDSDWAGSSIGGAVICSVVPLLTPVMGAAVAAACGVDAVIVTHEMTLPIRLGVPAPEQVGADRIANAAGFWVEHQCAGIVVDFGTATTFDVISSEGAYVGGAIAPGLETSAERLSQKGAQLFKVGIGEPVSPIGTTTEEALRSGLFYGSVGAVDEIVGRIAETMGGEPLVLATGGLAEIVSTASRTIKTVDQNLTLKGLKILYQNNT